MNLCPQTEKKVNSSIWRKMNGGVHVEIIGDLQGVLETERAAT